jgi:hypothetical protein
MSNVNATAQRFPSGQGIGFWITIGSFVGDEFGRETPGSAAGLGVGDRGDRTARLDRPAIATGEASPLERARRPIGRLD